MATNLAMELAAATEGRSGIMWLAAACSILMQAHAGQYEPMIACTTAANLGGLDKHGHEKDGHHMPEAVLATAKPVETSQDLLHTLVVSLGIRGHDCHRGNHLPAIQLPVEELPRLQIADSSGSLRPAGAHLAFQAHGQAAP